MSLQSVYRGRFAPSPTGPLHFGSLIAAMGSYLQAKHQHGTWLIRIDDIDPAREQKGASKAILKALEVFGFEWDEDVLYQSSHLKRYQEAINDLIKQQKAYPCSCSRKSILKETGQCNDEGEVIYPGLCRYGPLINKAETTDYSIRLRCNNDAICFNDPIQGKHTINLEKHIGDFIIQRRDQHFSYHLATGVDDAEQNITEVVRGADLLNCTGSQLYVQHALSLASPQYCHLPIAVNADGHKLSKQNHAEALEVKSAVPLLYQSLKFLGQMPPRYLMGCNQKDVWNWAKSHWRLDLVPKQSKLKIDWNND